MVDLYLQSLMHGEFVKKAPPKKKEADRFTQAIEKDIDRYLDTQSFYGSQLLSPELKRAKMKSEMMDAIEHSELNQQITLAFNILKNDGLKILDKEAYESMEENLKSAAYTIDTLDLNKETQKSLNEVLGFNSLTMDACVTIANAKFKEGLFDEALAICVLLSTLAPENSVFWYRTGIAAQNAKKNDFAIQAYEAAVELDPALYEAWIFSVQCYLSQGLHNEARDAFDKAKMIVQQITLEEPQKTLFSKIEEALKVPHL